MYEEFLRQAQEFNQSFWGGLFYFLGGVFFAFEALWQIRERRLWLAIMGLTAAILWDVMLLWDGRLFFGGLLALIVLVCVALAIAVEVQRRRQRA